MFDLPQLTIAVADKDKNSHYGYPLLYRAEYQHGEFSNDTQRCVWSLSDSRASFILLAFMCGLFSCGFYEDRQGEYDDIYVCIV